ncbi:MAG: pentapeptide repeat-containing protein [Bryobacterales bacterium]|nr:pentapeptide repeat-containing protein [Bryobacterales bacterium]
MGIPRFERQEALPPSNGRTPQHLLDLHQAWLKKLPGGVRADLSKSSLSDRQWQNVCLRQAVLNSTTWLDADLSDADLSGVEMSEADFRGATLNRIDFTAAQSERVRFDQCFLMGANMAEIKALETIWSNSIMPESRWLEATLQSCKLDQSKIAKSSWNQARLFGCDFSHANLESAVLYRVRAQLSRFYGTALVQANFTGSSIQDCNFDRADLTSAKLQNCDATRSSFTRTKLESCDFRGAKLGGCEFSGAFMVHARFDGAMLRGTDLRGANMKGARELTSEQLSQARTDSTTVLPNGSNGPYIKRSGAERPAR